MTKTVELFVKIVIEVPELMDEKTIKLTEMEDLLAIDDESGETAIATLVDFDTHGSKPHGKEGWN